MRNLSFLLLVAIFLFVMPLSSLAKTEKNDLGKPDFVLDISKENTYPNPAQDVPRLQPSELTAELLESSNVPIDNPEIIKMLNETTITNPKTAFLFRASIYLGEWPLNYESNETTINWEYEQVNTNYIDNRGGQSIEKIKYNQEQQKKVSGGLTAQIPHSDAVKKMMMMEATEKTGLPLAFETVVGYGTKTNQVYNVQPKNVGYLYSYVPAANEKGKVTYGEVYLTMKGGKRNLVIKNVTQQGIGAWIPIQDHVALKYYTANQPR